MSRARVPDGVAAVGGALRAAGHDAYLVGGCVRDLLRGAPPKDWDIATDARPDRLLALFPRARYQNKFGTVAVPVGNAEVEVTTFRRDGTYSDHRRPDDVTFGENLAEDLARRDFTVNAMALELGEDGAPGRVVDPTAGQADLANGVLRAVGEPAERFREDALRMLRAVRLAATLGFSIEPATQAAIAANASRAGHVSGERTLAELLKLLAAPVPSVGLRAAQETGLLAEIAPELAAQRGIPQAKIPREDLWDHTCRTVDAAPLPTAGREPVLRLAALLHDLGKPSTLADGHFVGHDAAGATLARTWLDGLHAPRPLVDEVTHLVAHHMFSYEPAWSDGAVRRFVRRVGPAAVDDLLDLRAADNVGSGLPADADALRELRTRVDDQLAARAALERGDLAVNGRDLVTELGLLPGPEIGRVLEMLVNRVLEKPSLNRRHALLALARRMTGRHAEPASSEEARPGEAP